MTRRRSFDSTIRMVATVATVLVTFWLIGASTGCGGGGPVSPRACAVLSDEDIQAVTHEIPSSVGGGDAGSQSTCAWALPNQAGGSVSAVLISCGQSGGCGGTFASLAPEARFTDLHGIGDRARISTQAGAAEGIVVERGGRVLQVRVDRIAVDAATALNELGRRAAPRL